MSPVQALAIAALCLGGTGCDPVLEARAARSVGTAAEGLRLVDWPAQAELNAALVLTFDGSLAPQSVTLAAVRAETPAGQLLPAVIGVVGGALVLELVVDRARLADPPDEVRLHLAGAPSPHALAALDGRRLPRSLVLAIGIEPRLVSALSRAPRLERAQGMLAPFAHPLVVVDALRLEFDGVLDPRSIAPANCPLFPSHGELLLEPVLPVVEWRCTGERTDLLLTPPPGAGRWTLPLRRWSVSDLSGRMPDPPVSLELERR